MATNEWNCIDETVSRIAANNSTDTMMATVTSPTSQRTIGSTTTTTKKITTTSDPGILCFHHCCVKVFCFILPRICPQCKMPLYDIQDNINDNSHNSNSNNNKNNTDNNQNTNININNTTISNMNSNSNHTNNNKGINEQDIINNGYIVAEQLNEQQKQQQQRNEQQQYEQQQQQSHSCDINRATKLLSNRLLPFRLPYPFIRASQYPCAIILRPTVGDFLNDYNNTTDLHIAVTTSTGCVVEFDRYGLRRRRTDHMPEWWQCLLVGDVPEPWYDYWDQVLLQVCQRPNKWTIAQYHKDKYNCYTFVLTFLKELSYDKLSEAANSRTTFCEKYIVPRTTTAGKYISLYRKLRVTGIYVHQIVQYNNNNSNSNCNSNKNHTNSKRINRQHYNNNSNNNTIPSMKYKIKGNNMNINSQHNSSNNNNNYNSNLNTTPPNSCNANGNGNGNDNGKEKNYDDVDGDDVSGVGVSAAINAGAGAGAGVGGNCLIIRPHTTLCTIEECE